MWVLGIQKAFREAFGRAVTPLSILWSPAPLTLHPQGATPALASWGDWETGRGPRTVQERDKPFPLQNEAEGIATEAKGSRSKPLRV